MPSEYRRTKISDDMRDNICISDDMRDNICLCDDMRVKTCFIKYNKFKSMSSNNIDSLEMSQYAKTRMRNRKLSVMKTI
jgi:hypothetical protein